MTAGEQHDRIPGPEPDESGTLPVAPGNPEELLVREVHVEGATIVSSEPDGEERRLAEGRDFGHGGIEERYRRARGEFARDFAAERATASDAWGRDRTFERAEPNYRAGFFAGTDLRYEGQEFEQIEPELHREYLASTASADAAAAGDDGERWSRLRAEIRAGFRKAREQR